eukprot:CAMPEP_0118877204 /NCGR_PEP_ID=MMETSP1163-20130328/17588_1 /TAXON_ID=124430 /ORGANISM="Phaeomonas parva, Strain CCMP2877" /LENGTH=36 /DNA_ID= /DNA_START= /DNA_END= /DNA_ORIENTATION=
MDSNVVISRLRRRRSLSLMPLQASGSGYGPSSPPKA